MLTFFRFLSSFMLLFFAFEKWVGSNHKKAIFVCAFLGCVSYFTGMFLLGGLSVSIPFFNAIKGVFGLLLLFVGLIIITMPYKNK